MAVFKDELKEENELQVALVELIGILFKTHKQYCGPLAEKILKEILPNLENSDDKGKQKLVIYLIDDMIEFLGPDFLTQDVYQKLVKQLCSFTGSQSAPLRQAAVYGLGKAAQHGGAAFAGVANDSLAALQVAITMKPNAATQEKKKKMHKFNHARDNAIAAFGRVIRYQNMNVDAVNLIGNWMELMPLKADVIEAKEQNEFLAEAFMKQPNLILGQNNERLEQFVTILGTICDPEQAEEETMDRLSVIVANLFQDPNLGA